MQGVSRKLADSDVFQETAKKVHLHLFPRMCRVEIIIVRFNLVNPIWTGEDREAKWHFARFLLYSSETVQPIFTKFCDFNHK